jgi:two-component system, OmpR family, alkaline phosphatase synthesis response regulator PhoP
VTRRGEAARKSSWLETGQRVVILAPDEVEREVLSHWTQRLGAAPVICRTFEQALVAWPPPGLAIVACASDKDDVAGALARLKQRLKCPIVCVAPRTAEPGALFASGVDDFVRRPYDLAELLSRIARFIRPPPMNRRLLACGPIVVDVAAREVHVGGERLVGKRTPTRKEFDLLVFLLERKEEVVQKREIVSEVLGGGAGASDDNAKAPVSLLRTKLGDAARYLETVRGVGFKITQHSGARRASRGRPGLVRARRREEK